ncbi:MAG: hypothetical protein IKJ31_05075 [Bacteroidaceae bacterium]|nr:hypothetical protein [Bacteroidaceae bacterium]
MKKNYLAVAVLTLFSASTFVSCDMFSGPSKSELKATVDSLSTQLNTRNSELDEVMGVFNQVSEGFRQIKEAENRVSIQSGEVENGQKGAKEQMISDLAFIQQKMTDNRNLIAELQEKLNNSKSNSAQLRKAVESLKAELEAKTNEIAALKEELASKNIRIDNLDKAVASLTNKNNELTARNNDNEKTLAQQDKELNSAWYALGSKKELKQNKILTNTGLFRKGDVMEDNGVNREYFTQIDIRNSKEIALGSKSAKVLSTHPEGSYSISKDESGLLTLKIENVDSFWSVTRYLVVKTK